jgi:hypothetical protein
VTHLGDGDRLRHHARGRRGWQTVAARGGDVGLISTS